MSNFVNILQKYKYSIICGTSNCGKTKYFFDKKIINKLILSVVNLNYILPLNITNIDFEKLNIVFINIRSGTFDLQKHQYCSILIDEVNKLLKYLRVKL